MTFTANEVTSSKPLTVNGELTASSLTLGAVAVTASAEQINKLTTVTATDTELNILDGVTGVSATNINQLSGVTSNINTFWEMSTEKLMYTLKLRLTLNSLLLLILIL